MGNATDLIFNCVSCGTYCIDAQSCPCGSTLFKVANTSTTGKPINADPDSQYDPYRQKGNTPEKGRQETNFGGEGTDTSSIGGPNDRPPLSPDSDPTGRPLPSDGGVGDYFPANSNANFLLGDDSPLSKPTSPNDINTYNFMRQNRQMKQKEDPYELIRKRKFR